MSVKTPATGGFTTTIYRQCLFFWLWCGFDPRSEDVWSTLRYIKYNYMTSMTWTRQNPLWPGGADREAARGICPMETGGVPWRCQRRAGGVAALQVECLEVETDLKQSNCLESAVWSSPVLDALMLMSVWEPKNAESLRLWNSRLKSRIIDALKRKNDWKVQGTLNVSRGTARHVKLFPSHSEWPRQDSLEAGDVKTSLER